MAIIAYRVSSKPHLKLFMIYVMNDFFFFFENPIYLQSVVVHSANGW
jgi:hypothetical protein